MPATVILNEKNGAGGTKTDKTSGTIRFKMTDDSDTSGFANPIQVPLQDQNYSMQKWLLAEITGGTFNQITDLGAYSDGANGLGTGKKIWAGQNAAYQTPVVPANTDDPPELNAVAMVDFFDFDSTTKLELGEGPFTTTDDIGDHLVLVAEVEAGAEQGVSPGEALTLSWLEV